MLFHHPAHRPRRDCRSISNFIRSRASVAPPCSPTSGDPPSAWAVTAVACMVRSALPSVPSPIRSVGAASSEWASW
ncbi:MAG TPA: hypothetical protein DCE47_21810 [Planctomycetaceae bacterium]|nr:hypothetical protein [Planctomycetaceae bacterium]